MSLADFWPHIAISGVTQAEHVDALADLGLPGLSIGSFIDTNRIYGCPSEHSKYAHLDDIYLVRDRCQKLKIPFILRYSRSKKVYMAKTTSLHEDLLILDEFLRPDAFQLDICWPEVSILPRSLDGQYIFYISTNSCGAISERFLSEKIKQYSEIAKILIVDYECPYLMDIIHSGKLRIKDITILVCASTGGALQVIKSHGKTIDGICSGEHLLELTSSKLVLRQARAFATAIQSEFERETAF